VLSYFIFEKNRFIFLGAELLIVISITLSINLYKELIKPLDYLKEGINAIKDRDFTVKFIATGKKDMDALIEVYNQMIDALRAERLSKEEQHFFLEKLIQKAPVGIVILDFHNQIDRINPKAEKIINDFPELLSRYIFDLAAVPKIIKSGLKTFKLQKSNFIDRGFERDFILIEEVTAEILQAEKNVYSKVIRMMAHEVNNTIGPVNSIMNVALQTSNLWQFEDTDSIKSALQVAIDRNENLNIFMRNFADLVKLPQVNKQKVDLLHLVKSIAELMQFNVTNKQINFEYDLPKTPYYISADAQQLEQVLLNIIKNAQEAIEIEGTIKISVFPTTKQLIISNTGKEITKEQEEKLFTPFYSTKKDGKGIGLMLIREILLNHGYEFSLKSIVPQQTDFVINLH
jgi:nitrogen fixation/metabolism regulation signal transduction histidine kinase